MPHKLRIGFLILSVFVGIGFLANPTHAATLKDQIQALRIEVQNVRQQLGAQLQQQLPEYMVAGITRTPAQPKVGESVTVRGSIRNIGPVASTASSTTTITITGPNSYISTLPSQTTSPLPPSTTESEVWTWTPTEVGVHTIRICADTSNTISELYEFNNCRDAAITVEAPVVQTDCLPTSYPITVLYPNGAETFTMEQQIEVRWRICSIPQVLPPAQSTLFQLVSWNGSSYATSLYFLDPNPSYLTVGVHSKIITLPVGVTTPQARMILALYGDGQIVSDISDNSFIINAPTQIQPLQPRLPEYMVRAVSYSTSGQPEAGKPITITGTVKNVGYTASTVPSVTSATITGPNSYTITLTPQTTGALAQNATETEKWTGPDAWIPPSAGTYTIKICTDANNDIVEIYEYQNCKSVNVMVNPAPLGKIFLAGGQDGTNIFSDFYSSNDGVVWTLVSQNNPWNPGVYKKILYYTGKIYLFDNDGSRNLWSSSSGVTWNPLNTLPMNNAAIATSVYNGKIYVLGGFTIGGVANATAEVWTYDGTTWNQVDHSPAPGIQNAPWQPRAYANSIVYNNELYIIYGEGGGPNDPSDMWSYDGNVWTNRGTVPWSQNKYTGAYSVFNDGTGNKIYVLGGYDSAIGNNTSEVWTYDGTIWMRKPDGPWTTGDAGSSYVLNGKLYFVGGQSSSGTQSHDIWSTANGATWILESSNPTWSPRSYFPTVVR